MIVDEHKTRKDKRRRSIRTNFVNLTVQLNYHRVCSFILDKPSSSWVHEILGGEEGQWGDLNGAFFNHGPE
jgi:hypothetical protein